jgi:hypothetical protein
MKQKRYLTILTILLMVTTILTLIWAVGTAVAQQPPEPPNGRLIIKDGYVEIMVPNTDDAVASLEQIANGNNAYVLTQEVWDDGDHYQYARYQFGLPADQFETMINSVKVLGTVLDESATGQEVTDSAIDLTARLENLYANQARMQSFLANATTITETLHVHERLTRIEVDINELQGQLRGVSGRAVAATLTVQIVPLIPTPTPLPTSTPTPLPTPQIWRPGDTAKIASVELQESVQSNADVAIYRLIVCAPWLIFLLAIGFPVYLFIQRRRRRA